MIRLSRKRPRIITGQYASSITQHGITWTFDQPRQVGQFVTGDWWVKGPLTITSVSPGWTTSSVGFRNGSMLDPQKGLYQGLYDGSSGEHDHYPYSASVRATFPLSVGSGTHSLISTVGKASPQVGGAYCALDDAAILTITDQDVPTDAFRPAYYGTKTFHRWSQVNAAAVPALALPSGASLPATTGAESIERPWLQMGNTSTAGQNAWRTTVCPANNMPPYPRDQAVAMADMALATMIRAADNPNRDLYLKRIIQLGIDYYGIDQSGPQNVWYANGGFGIGGKLPVLLAGALLTGSNIVPTALMADYGTGLGERYSEDGFTFYYSGSPRWGRDPTVMGDVLPYWDNHVLRQPTDGGEPEPGPGIPPSGAYEWTAGTYRLHDVIAGDTAANSPFVAGKIYRCKSTTLTSTTKPTGGTTPGDLINLDGGQWEYLGARTAYGSSYRGLNSYVYPGMMIAALQYGLKTAWAHDAFFDYTDRWVADQYHPGYTAGTQIFLSAFAKRMWETYR